jgi:hypothetical protein
LLGGVDVADWLPNRPAGLTGADQWEARFRVSPLPLLLLAVQGGVAGGNRRERGWEKLRLMQGVEGLEKELEPSGREPKNTINRDKKMHMKQNSQKERRQSVLTYTVD